MNEMFSAVDARARESFADLALDSPGHRAHEALRRGRRVGGADLQDLRHERRVVGDPVPHDDPAARAGHAHHLLGHVERSRREHRAEDADDQVEGIVAEAFEVRGVALLEPAVREAFGLRPSIPRFHEIARDVDAEHVGSEPRCRQRGRAVAAAEVENLHPLTDPDVADERLAALPHARCDAGEVALLPERFVRIHPAPPWSRGL